MKKTIFEKDYYGDNINDLFADLHYEIDNTHFETDKYGIINGTISIKITYSTYKEE